MLKYYRQQTADSRQQTADSRQQTADIALPPCPSVLMNIQQEMAHPHANLHSIAKHIACDIALAAEVLRTVNSPFFGLRNKVGSIPDAINLIGIDRTLQMVRAVSIRQNIPLPTGLEHFWRDAMSVAVLNSAIAKHLKVDVDMAHLMGLFHDCAIPLMAAKFPCYLTSRRNLECGNLDITLAEQNQFGANHALLGSLIARTWHLPESLTQAIRFHHADDLFTQGLGSKALTLITVNLLAKQVYNYICGQVDSHFEAIENQVRDYLHLSDDTAYQHVIDVAMDAVQQ